MKILITNTALTHRSGSELYVKDIALELKRRGNDVIAYSNVCGKLAKEMNRLGIMTVDNLELVPKNWKPDIIHGQHHLETMTAISYFPKTPVAYFCHGWRPWQEKPPLHPRIVEYSAVDSMTLDFAVKNGVPKNRIRLIHNFVDLERFKQRDRLPEIAKKALVFSNYAAETNYLPLVREACEKAGLKLDTVGLGTGKAVSEPEKVINKYDIVFAYGRSALESLAVGNAVVICGIGGIGPMVTFKEMKKLRDLNFGIAAIKSKPDAKVIYNEILKYNAEDSFYVTQELRNQIGIKEATTKIENFYKEGIQKFKSQKTEPLAEIRALSKYLNTISSFIKARESEQNELVLKKDREIGRLIEEKEVLINKHQSENEKLSNKLKSSIEHSQNLDRKIIELQEEIKAMKYSKFWKLREHFVKAKNLIKKQ